MLFFFNLLFLVSHSTADMNIAVMKDMNLNLTIGNYIENTVTSCKMRCERHSDCTSIGIKEISNTGQRPFVCFLLLSHIDTDANKMLKEKGESEKMIVIDKVSKFEIKEKGCQNKTQEETSTAVKSTPTDPPVIANPVYSSTDTLSVREGKELVVLKRLYKTYKLKFELKLYAVNKDVAYASIIRLTIGNDYGTYGDRTPAILLEPDHRLTIASAVNGQINFYYRPDIALKTLRWYKIMVSQTKIEKGTTPSYVFRIKIDGDSIYEIENSDAREFAKVTLYASDPWLEPAVAQLRNVELHTSPA